MKSYLFNVLRSTFYVRMYPRFMTPDQLSTFNFQLSTVKELPDSEVSFEVFHKEEVAAFEEL